MMKKLPNISKLIMLTFFVSCVTIFFVGCENGNIEINNSVSGESDFIEYLEEEHIKSRRRFKRN